MSDVRTLYSLQNLDLRIDAATASHQEIAAQVGDTSEVDAVRARADDLRQQVHDRRGDVRALELETESLAMRIAAEEKKLFAGTIHNPKELENLRRDVEHTKENRRKLEEQLLERMGALEAIEAELAGARDQLAAITASWGDHRRELLERQSKTAEELAHLRAERAELAAKIPREQIVVYDRLRREKRGHAVATVERSTCLGCRINLPSGIVQRARAQRELVYCPSCGRILFV